MSLITACFETLAQQNRKALIPFVTAGDPNPDVTVPLLHALVEAGADLLELGVPFSDPMADGPVIQAACERALRHHVTLHQVLEMVSVFRVHNTTTPVILMGYLNPIEVWGYADFADAAAAAGVDGVLTVDMPPEESVELVSALRAHDIDTIFLLAPTSDEQRMTLVSQVASGFLYYVSFKGVTGADRLDVAAVDAKLEELRRFTNLPIGVGFGIRDAASAARVAAIADAVVVGSALVGGIPDLVDRPDTIPGILGAALAEMRAAMDRQEATR